MRLIHPRQSVQTVALRWHRQYVDRQPGDFYDRIAQALQALDAETATVAEVERLIGNDTWTTELCDECGRRVHLAVELGEAPDIESRTATICLPCLVTAWHRLIRAARAALLSSAREEQTHD